MTLLINGLISDNTDNTNNHYQIEYFFEFHWNSLVLLEKCETNTRVLWSWNDFPVYKYNGISFAAHLARSLILMFSISAQENAILLFVTEKAKLLPQTYGIYL